MPGLHISFGINPNYVCAGSVRNPHFAAIKNVLVTLLLSFKLHACNIRATIGFTHCKCTNEVPAAELWEILLFLGFTSVKLELIYAKVAMS